MPAISRLDRRLEAAANSEDVSHTGTAAPSHKEN